MYHGDLIDSDETGSDSSEPSLPAKRRKAKGNKNSNKSGNQLTWAEAAEIILKRFDHPLPPKEVFKLMQEADLKTDVCSASPVAVLNTVLNNQSKGASPIFYKCPTGASSYGLIKTRRKPHIGSAQKNPSNEMIKKLNETKYKMREKLTLPTAAAARSLNPPGQKYPAPSMRVKKPLIPPGETTAVTFANRYTPPQPLCSLSKAAYLERLKQQPQHRRMMGPTTSALVRPSPPFSRPPPGAALRVMPPKKRIKIDRDEDDSDSSTQSKNNDEPVKKPIITKIKTTNNDARKVVSSKSNIKLKQNQRQNLSPLKLSRSLSSPQLKNKINDRTISKKSSKSTLQQRLSLSNTNNKILTQMKKSASQPSLQNTRKLTNNSLSQSSWSSNTDLKDGDNKQPFFIGVKFKKLKRGGFSGKESKMDLMAPDSVLSSIQIKDLFNVSNFRMLPASYQYQLLTLLPDCDRSTAKDGSLRLSPEALNNGFFSRACQEYKDKLLDGDLNSDIITRAKQEIKTYSRLDAWKVKHFEPVYGQSSVDYDDDGKEEEGEEKPREKPQEKIKPIESSWVPFLKFAENSTEEYVKTLSDIQAQVRRSAEREAKENEEAVRQRKEELLQRSKLFSPIETSTSTTSTTIKSKPSAKTSANNNKTNTTANRLLSSAVRQPVRGGRALLARSPMINRSPATATRPSAMVDATKEKSKRALKRAQLLQRKKIFDKQLKDAKARILEEARRSGAQNRKDITAKTTTIRNDGDHNKNLKKSISLSSSASLSKDSIILSQNKNNNPLSPSDGNNGMLLETATTTTTMTTKTKTIVIGEKRTSTETALTTTTGVDRFGGGSSTMSSADSAVQKFIQDSETAVMSVAAETAQLTDTTAATTVAATVETALLTSKSLQTAQKNITTTTTINQTPTTLASTISESMTSTTPSTKPAGTSRIVHGAASFGSAMSSSNQGGAAGGSGVCPCNMKAMFLCKRCGSAWHGDCIDSDNKICISCS